MVKKKEKEMRIFFQMEQKTLPKNIERILFDHYLRKKHRWGFRELNQVSGRKKIEPLRKEKKYATIVKSYYDQKSKMPDEAIYEDRKTEE